MAEAKSAGPPTPEQFKELLSSVPAARDQEARLALLLRAYRDTFASLQEEWEASGRQPELEDLALAPDEEIEGLLSQWRTTALEDTLRLDREPPLKLHAEELCAEVCASSKSFGGLGVLGFALRRLLQRQGALRCQRQNLVALSNEEGTSTKVDRSSIQKRRLSGLPAATSSPVTRALHTVDSELEFGTRRLRRIRDHLEGKENCPQTGRGSFLASTAWRGAATVLVRQQLLEEVATKDLRRYLLQLQYLGFAARARIWRKSLEHRAVMEIACEGSSGGCHRVIQSNLGSAAPLLSVPLGPTNRKRMERAMQELAQGFSLGHTTMQPDRGKTFAHQVGLSFADIFETQQQQWQFQVYPVQSGLGPQVAAPFEEEGRCFLRPSSWAQHLPWKPKLDPEFEEQNVLLEASYSRRSTLSRVSALSPANPSEDVEVGGYRNPATYARQLLDQAAAQLGPSRLSSIVEVPGHCAVDSLLGAELKTLQLVDSAAGIRRCNEKAEEPVGGPGAADFTASEKLPNHLLRAYYMLRYLQSRSLRWQLLQSLNFFRFLQRRVLAGVAAVQTTEMDAGKGSNYIGRGGDPSRRVEEKAQDKYWDISSRGLSRILQHCSLPLVEEGHSAESNCFVEVGRKLDRETFKRSDDIVLDSMGRRVLHEAALEDLELLELDMLKIGSYFIHKYEATSSEDREVAAVDRCAVLYDLLSCEVWFNTEKRNLLEVYLTIFEHTTDLLERQQLAQRICDLVALRPRLDLQESYFLEAFGAAVLLLRSRAQLLKELLQHQVGAEVVAGKRVMAKTERAASRSAGQPSVRSTANAVVHNLEGGLAHPQEGSALCGGVPFLRKEGETMCVEGDKLLSHSSCCLAWKAELVLESVHRHMAQHFQPPSPVASTQLERACYVVALERWAGVQDKTDVLQMELQPQEDPELQVSLLQELAKRLVGIDVPERTNRWRAERGEKESKADGLVMNDQMSHAFEELAEHAQENTATLADSLQLVMGTLLSQAVEAVELRGQLMDVHLEVQHLQQVLSQQALDFGSSIRPLTCLEGDQPLKDQFTAGLVSKSLGTLDFSSNNSLALLCSVPKLQELRQMLQHELAFRCLALACVQQNALLLDAQTRWREQNDIGTVGLSRDAISMDGGLGVMRRLRDSLEVSGHDQHHAHARAEEVPSAVTTSEISRASVEDKGQGSAIMDMSRYAQYLQQPARYLEPVLQALGRTSTRVIFKLLRCSALLALRFGCELLLGLQLAQSASSLAGIAMLIPKSLTPFTYGDRLNPLVRDGQVGSVFSLPSTFDALRLALPIFDPSKVEALVERADLDFEVQLLETLDLRSSVASVALQLLASVSRLVTLRYAIVMVDADPVWLLEAQRNGRYLATEEHFRQNTRSVQDRSEEDKSEERSRAPAEETDVGRAGPGYETMEELCADLARLARRLDGQKPAGRKPEQVLAVLGSEIACAGRQLALMLRWSGRRLQQDPEAPDLRQWSRLIEGCESSHPRWLLPLDVRKMTPVPKNSPCMENWDELGSMRPEMPDSECVEAMPAIVRLREGAGSYLAQFHPELCSEFRALAGALRQQFVVEPPCAKVDIIRLPWLAPSSSPKLLRLPLGLSHKRRQQLSRARASLAERCRVLVHKNMSIDQAVYAEAEFYGLYLLRERLQEAVVAGQLGLSKLPTDKEGIARFRTQMAATIPPEEPAEPLFGELEPQALSREVAAIRTQLAKLMPALSQLLHSATSEWLSEEVAALTSLQYRLQATKSAKLTKPTGAPSTSASIIDQSPATSISKSPTLKEAHKSGSRISISREASLLTGGPYASKLVGQTAINQLLQKSTYVRMGNDPEGETAHVLKELQINACLEELADELWSWGRHIALTREKRTEEALGYLDHLKDVLKFCLAKTEVDTIREGHLLESPAELVWLKGFADEMKGKREEMEAQFRADLAARCVKMVFEVDRAHRAQRDLKAAAGEIQSRLQGEIMDQVRGSISNFTGALAAEAGRFKESHGDDQDRLAVQLRDLREHVTSELASLAAKNQAVQMKAAQPRQVGLETLLPEKDGAIDFQALASELEAEDDRSPLKRRHSGMARRNSNAKPPVLTLTVSDGMYQKLAEVAQREDVYVLQRRLQQLKDRQLMERIFHKLKCQAMRQHFERKVQEQEATLGSNSSLLAQLAHVSRAESAAAKDFIRGAQDVSHAEKRTEELGPLTESNAEQKRRLAKWKKNKSKQLYHMKKGVRDHEMAGTMDVASLLQDIQQKQELVKILQQNQKESEQEVLLASARSAKDTARVRAALMEQRQVKDETFRELQRLRADMQRPEGQKNVEYWREKVLEIRQRMEDLEEENSKLRILLASRTE